MTKFVAFYTVNVEIHVPTIEMAETIAKRFRPQLGIDWSRCKGIDFAVRDETLIANFDKVIDWNDNG